MKKTRIAALFATMAMSVAAQADTYVLKVTHFLPANSNAQANVIEPWCKQLSEESNKRIQCQLYPSMQLGGTPATLPDMVRNGVADIVWTAPGYSPGKFPRVEALELPFMLPYGGSAANRIIWSYYEQYAKDDFKGYKVLALFGDGGMDIHTRNKPVQTLEDFKGLKLRASGRTLAKALEAVGATPVSMPPAQMTEAISKGVVDGAMATWEVVPPTKLEEVTTFHSAVSDGQPAMAYTVLGMFMNPRKYERMPADLKPIFDRHVGLALVDRFGTAWEKAMADARGMVPADSIVTISDAEYTRIKQAASGVTDAWIKEMNGKGLDGQKLVEGVRSLSPVAR